jgi:hypothetical protein
MQPGSMLIEALRLVRRWDWGLLALIFLSMGLPQVYRSYSIYLIGSAGPRIQSGGTGGRVGGPCVELSHQAC